MTADRPLRNVVQQSEQIDAGLSVLAKLGNNDDDHVIQRATITTGLFIPPHRHKDIECLHVMEGRLDVYLGDHGRWFTVRASESIVVPSDVTHAIRNFTDQPTHVIGVVTVRLTAFLRDLGVVAAALDPERTREERMQTLRRLAERYGYWLASPSDSETIRDIPAENGW